MPLTKEEPKSGNLPGDDNTNLWQSILNDVQKHGNPKLNPNKQIVVLGDNESGKTTMVMTPNHFAVVSYVLLFRWQSCKALRTQAKVQVLSMPTSV